MDFTGLNIKPAEGKLVVMFVDDDDDDDEDDAPASTSGAPEAPDFECCLAIVQSVGDKVKTKAGQTIVVRPWARDGIKLGDNLTIIDAYDVVATIGK